MNRQQHARFYQELQREIKDLEAKLEQLYAVAQYHGQKAGILEVTERSTVSAHAAIHAHSPTGRPVGRFARTTQADAAEVVLGEEGKELSARQIAEKMIAGGYPARDRPSLQSSVFTAMNRRPNVFRKCGQGLWTLVTTDSPTPVK